MGQGLQTGGATPVVVCEACGHPQVAPAAGLALLELRGEFWTIAYQGTRFALKDSTGLRHLARLLSEPGAEVHALELSGGMWGSRSDAGALLDARAKTEYRRRLEDLRAEIDEAEAWCDPERAARARDELQFLACELGRAVGLGGRDRRAASDAERARVNVTRAVKGAIRKIADNDARLGDYLAACVHTGQFCSYLPSAHARVDWDIELGAMHAAA
jgi:hypothetical protein